MQINLGIIDQIFDNLKLRNVLRYILLFSVLILTVVLIIYMALIKVPVWQENKINKISASFSANKSVLKENAIKKERKALENKLKTLDSKISNLIPKSYYLLINTTRNEFYLYKNKSLVRKGQCSTGSYTLLVSEKRKKQWIFKTPKGKFSILSKRTDPVWTKPDWAFVEEGLPVPPANHPSRYETGVLGDYALSLGQGYMIHGTLYKRFLGMPVTHGCIRLNDDDLEVIYHSLEIGSRVYIF